MIQVSIQIDLKLTVSVSLFLWLYFKTILTLCLVKPWGFFVGFFSYSWSVWRRQFDHNGLMQATFLGLPGCKPGLCVYVYTHASPLLLFLLLLLPLHLDTPSTTLRRYLGWWFFVCLSGDWMLTMLGWIQMSRLVKADRLFLEDS